MNLEVKIEIRSIVKKEPNVLADGNTHSFIVYVQGVNGNNIEPFIKEVVFHLPPNAPNPEQVINKPPYLISGSTNVSFRMFIDLFLHASENISKLRYSYYVPVPDKPLEKSVCVKTLTFLNAPQDFRERLLLGGAEAVNYEKKEKAVVVKAKSKSGLDENVQKQDVEIKKEISNELPNSDAQSSSSVIEKKGNVVIEKVLNFDELMKENKAIKERNETLKRIYSNQESLLAAYAEKLTVVKQKATATFAELNQLKEKSAVNKAEIADLKSSIQRVTSEILQFKNSSKANEGRTSPEVLLITD